MKAGNLVAGDAAHQRLLANLGSALCAGALPGELKEFGEEDCRAAAEFVAGCASRRPAGSALVRIESTGTRLGNRRMRATQPTKAQPAHHGRSSTRGSADFWPVSLRSTRSMLRASLAAG